jgi:hypothetical protein
LKTLAQFYLLGDPSIHAVSIPAHKLNATSAFKKAFAKTRDGGPRALRRERLRRVGFALARDLPATRASGEPASREVRAVLAASAKESGLLSYAEHHFAIVEKRGRAASSAAKRTLHMLVSSDHIGHSATEPGLVRRVTLLVATADNGKLVHLRRLHSR